MSTNYSPYQAHIVRLFENYSIPRDHIAYLEHLKHEQQFEPKVIYDIGANVLHWTRESQKIWPNAKHVLFDAFDPVEFMFKDYQYHMGVLSDLDGRVVKFYQNDEHPAGNSYYKEIGHANAHIVYPENKYIEKVTRTLDSIVDEKHFPWPDLIKIDVQGAEVDILKGATRLLKYAQVLIVEMQEVEYNRGAPKVFETLPWIESLGWKCVAKKFSDNGPDADYAFQNTATFLQKNVLFKDKQLQSFKQLQMPPTPPPKLPQMQEQTQAHQHQHQHQQHQQHQQQHYKTRILLATPCYGNMVTNGYFLSIVKMIAEYADDPDINISIYTIGNESLITRARNMCVSTCLIGDYTHLLFVDADIEFEPSVIRRLVDKNTDVACAPYAKKTIKWEHLKDPKFHQELVNPNRTLKDIKKMMLAFNVHWKTIPPQITPDNWTEVDRAGTGFMLIKRNVFTRLAKAMPELKYDMDDESEINHKDHLYSFFDCIKDKRNKYLSEDYAFCERVRTVINGQIWVDLSAELGHMGTMVYKGC